MDVKHYKIYDVYGVSIHLKDYVHAYSFIFDFKNLYIISSLVGTLQVPFNIKFWQHTYKLGAAAIFQPVIIPTFV